MLDPAFATDGFKPQPDNSTKKMIRYLDEDTTLFGPNGKFFRPFAVKDNITKANVLAGLQRREEQLWIEELFFQENLSMLKFLVFMIFAANIAYAINY